MVAPRYAGTEPLTEEMLNSMFGRECDSSSTDPREAQDSYELAWERHHEAWALHAAAEDAWGQDYANDSYPVPPCPVPPYPAPPCDGSSTDPWESAEGVHGCCARQYVERPTGNARVDAEVAKADARVKAWDESVARVQEMCRKFKHIKC